MLQKYAEGNVKSIIMDTDSYIPIPGGRQSDVLLSSDGFSLLIALPWLEIFFSKSGDVFPIKWRCIFQISNVFLQVRLFFQKMEKGSLFLFSNIRHLLESLCRARTRMIFF